MIRPVRTYPDPVLLDRCQPASVSDAERVAADLVDTMRSLPRCVGLAAPQIGAPVRVAVVDCSRHPAAGAHNGLLLLCDPRILDAAGRELGREGCQSLPWYTVDVVRSRRIALEPEPGRLVWSSGFEARAIQHEIDHLDGILILDRAAGARAVHRRGTPPPAS
ncbi:peptide deformylase [Candidatus Nephthysia bennettiae]|uniref:peptide deformylase n=1 Tax=Candidatus Nephthysia bennettiae TaxID=3127016 RepID=UPI0030C69EED